ncbi:MAG: cation:proton antiporter [Paracoccaceae bacterium]
MDSILYQAFIYLAAAVVAVPLARRLGFGSVLGYLVAGLVIGPVIGLVGAETADLQHFAEFGVVMMLFVIGLELEPRALWAMRKALIGLGGMQIVITTLLISLIAWSQGIMPSVSIAIGITLALSSTAIVMQTLDEKQLARTDGGRSAFFVLLMQDIAVIPALALLPLLAIPGLEIMAALSGQEAAHGNETQEWIASQSPFIASAIVLGAVALVAVVGVFLVGPLFRYIALSKMREIFIAAALLLVIAIALLMTAVGLSPALGTFMAGVLLANSAYKHQLEADIEPIKGLLLGLFFITVGAGINTGLLWEKLWVILSITIALMVLKFAVLWLVGWGFGLRGRTQLLFALSLAQAGEFGFVMIGFALQAHVMARPLAELLGLVVALSMFLTPVLFILFDRMVLRMASTQLPEDDRPVMPEGKIIVAGLGRFGQVVNRLLLMNGHPTTVIDGNAEAVHRMRQLGVKAFLGDVTRPELLIAAGIAEAAAVVVAIDDADKAVKIVEFIRQNYPKVHVVARARSRHDVYRLYAAGARDIVRETFDSSVRAGKYTLRAMGVHPYDAERAADEFVREDRQMLLEMASDWDPKLQLHENPALLARIREQNLRIEAMLRGETEPATEPSSERS